MTNAHAVFEALGDQTRRAVFERVAAGPRSVTELAGELPVSRPAVSQHLRALRLAGLVAVRSVGTRRIYRVDPAGVAAIQMWLSRFWADSLESFAAEAERVSRSQQGE